jgi:hypothetical protein
MELVSPWHANIGDILSRIFKEGACGRFRLRVLYPINLGQMSQPQPVAPHFKSQTFRDSISLH